MTTEYPPIRRVGIIGAGVSGVATAAHLLAEGLDVTVFERAPVSGGVWVWDPERPLEPAYPTSKASTAEFTFSDGQENKNPHLLYSSPGPCYDSLRNNVPTELLEMSINKWKPNTESFVKHSVLAQYIQDTSEKTGVKEKTLFNTKVEHLKKENGQWKVDTLTWDHDTKTTVSKNWSFDAVVVAAGHYHAPSVPSIPGLKEWKSAWPSRVQHSKSYRNNQGFENKTVLLIGGSASSTDIAVELEPVAKKVWQSTRGGQFDLPASKLPEGVARVGEIASFDQQQEKVVGDSDAIPATVTLVDGTTLSDIDRVVVATGYQFSLPFLPEYHADDVAPQDADERVLVTNGLQLHNLHKDIVYIPDPTLLFVGVPFYTATFSLFEFQAITVAALLSGKTKLPSKEDMRTEYSQRVHDKGYGKKFHSLMGKDVEYAEELMQWVNQGRAPSEKKPDGYSAEWKAIKEKMTEVAHTKNSLYKGNRAEVEVK